MRYASGTAVTVNLEGMNHPACEEWGVPKHTGLVRGHTRLGVRVQLNRSVSRERDVIVHSSRLEAI